MRRAVLAAHDVLRFARNPAMTTSPLVIGVDWGTSNFRAWLMDDTAHPMETVTSPEGLLNVPGRGFSAALNRACGAWLDRWPGLPLLMCGMVCSRQGWVEATYLQGDAGAGDLGASLAIAPSPADLRIVTGLQSVSYDGAPDVMRGEETQLVGAMDLGAPKDAVVCMPGTRSKWVELRDRRISSITTFLTGELYALLRDNSILSGLIAADGDVAPHAAAKGFGSGLAMGLSGGALTHQLFSIRAQSLTGSGCGATAKMLSGVLIGSELATLLPKWAGRDIVLIASGAIAARYKAALLHVGIKAQVIDGDGSCRAGLAAISHHVPEWRMSA